MSITEIKKKRSQNRHACCDCKKKGGDVTREECPYASEILNDHTKVSLCVECRRQRAMDIWIYKVGDYVVALQSTNNGDIKEGHAYEVYEISHDHIWVVKDEEGELNGWAADMFAFLCHDPSELSELERVLYGLD